MTGIIIPDETEVKLKFCQPVNRKTLICRSTGKKPKHKEARPDYNIPFVK